MAASHSQAADGHARRVARNSDELRVAEHLIATVRDRLAGRDEAGQELAGIRPRERVVLGVLLPQPRPLVMPAGTASPVPYEPGVPVDHLPASEMGLTAQVEPDATEITLRVRPRSPFTCSTRRGTTSRSRTRGWTLTYAIPSCWTRTAKRIQATLMARSCHLARPPTFRPSLRLKTSPHCHPMPPLQCWPLSAEPGSTPATAQTTAPHPRPPGRAVRARAITSCPLPPP